MVKVILCGSVSQMAGGETEMEVEATTVQQIFRHLRERYPNIQPHMENDIAIAIDGTIYQDAWFKKVSEDSEIQLLPRIGGG